MQDPLNGGEFRKRFGVGSTRPMFKSTDERKRAFYLYYYPAVRLKINAKILLHSGTQFA